MKHFSFDVVAFERGNCVDRNNPVLLRDVSALIVKLLVQSCFIHSHICQQRVSQS